MIAPAVYFDEIKDPVLSRTAACHHGSPGWWSQGMGGRVQHSPNSLDSKLRKERHRAVLHQWVKDRKGRSVQSYEYNASGCFCIHLGSPCGITSRPERMPIMKLTTSETCRSVIFNSSVRSFSKSRS